MARTKKKKLNKMDVFLIIDLLLIIVFTVIMINIYLTTYAIPDTLCMSVFSVLGGELGIMGWIKTSKEREESRKAELQDRKYFEKLQKEQEKNI